MCLLNLFWVWTSLHGTRVRWRAYTTFWFGYHGLSISQFRRLGAFDQYRTNVIPASLSSDFSTPPPPAPVPKTSSELGAVTRRFVVYTQAMCDDATVQLAAISSPSWRGGGSLQRAICQCWSGGLTRYSRSIAMPPLMTSTLVRVRVLASEVSSPLRTPSFMD